MVKVKVTTHQFHVSDHVRDQSQYGINKYLVISQDLYTNNCIQIADGILVLLGVIMCVKNPNFRILTAKSLFETL